MLSSFFFGYGVLCCFVMLLLEDTMVLVSAKTLSKLFSIDYIYLNWSKIHHKSLYPHLITF
jgi:uncharacterized membrane protein YjjP (DUF1212 family)